MKNNLLIYGAGGLGKEVLSWIRLLDEFVPIGFIDDGLRKDSVVKGLKVLGGLEVLHDFPTPVSLVLAIGDPRTKSELVMKINRHKVNYPVLIHPRAILQEEASVHLGEGSILTPGCVLTTDISIGNHVLINLNAAIGHDVEIGSCSSIMTGVNVAGGAKIGEGVLIGSGANILNRVKLGDFCKVGMGAVVIRDVEAESTVVGVPARRT